MPDPFMLKTHAEEAEWAAEENQGIDLANAVIAKGDPSMTVRYRTAAGKQMVEQLAILSWNQKMRAPSFDLPALRTCPGAGASLEATQHEMAEVGKGALLRYPGICTLCYASKGPYVWPSNVTRMKAKQDFSEGPDFVDTMIAAIRDPRKFITREFRLKQYDPRYFRVHSSGDFYDGEYVDKWAVICAEFPETKFWFPSRAWAAPTLKIADLIEPLLRLTSLPNVIVRPSALAFNVLPTYLVSIHGINWAAPSGGLIFKDMDNVQVRIGGKEQRLSFRGMPELEKQWEAQGVWFCPATPRDHGDNKISDTWNCVSQKCRRCWEAPDTPIIYRVH
jgi:hypothetical protein